MWPVRFVLAPASREKRKARLSGRREGRTRRAPAKGVYTIMYACAMSKTVPVRELRANLSSLLDAVTDRRDHVLVTRNGVPAAALVPIDEYEALEETAEILSDPAVIAALDEGLGQIERGETVTLAELRKELAAMRPTSD